MKTLKYIIASALLLAGISASAQSSCCAGAKTECETNNKKGKQIETASFTVHGVCLECKERIENAALIKGVKSAEWDKATHTLSVVFDTNKVSLMDIHNSIANAGHKTNKIDENHEAYAKLPKCCAYRKGSSPCGHNH